jgi:hypothetical protein
VEKMDRKRRNIVRISKAIKRVKREEREQGHA